MPRPPQHATPTRVGSFAPRLSSTPQAPRSVHPKKLRVVKSEMRPSQHRPVKREPSPPPALDLDDYGGDMDCENEGVGSEVGPVEGEGPVEAIDEVEESKEEKMTVDV